jgi:DnaJ-domain-containing protein 1
MSKSISEVCEDVRIEANDPNPDVSVLGLALAVIQEYRNNLHNKLNDETQQLQARIEKVNTLNRLKRLINAAKKDGKLDCKDNTELTELLDKVRTELDLNDAPTVKGEETPSHTPDRIPGIKNNSTKYSKEETEGLLDSLTTAIEDLNVKNQMQQQTVTRLYNEQLEGIHLARLVGDTHKTTMSKIIQGINR